MSANQDDIRVRIAGDLSDINKALQDLRRQARAAGKDARDSGRDWNALGVGLTSLRNVAVKLGAAFAGFQLVTGLFRNVITNTIEAERVAAQLAARVRSTGEAAGFTTDELLGMAREFQRVTTFGDEAVASMQSVLLTFTNVRGEQFVEATKAILDMSAALGTDLESAATQVGRALNDPVQGMQALTRFGITLSGAQKALVRQLVETNRVGEAQGVILDELRKKFGGSAAAGRDTLSGAIEAVKNSFGDLFEASGPEVEKLKDALEGLAAILSDPATAAAAANLARTIIDGFSKATEIIAGLNVVLTNAQPVQLEKEIRSTEAAIASLERRLARLRNAPPLFREEMIAELIAARAELARLRAEQERLLGIGAGGVQRATTPSSGGGTAAPVVIQVDPREALKELQASLAAARVLLDDEVKRVGAALDRDFEQNLVRFSEYFSRRADLERQAIENELAQRRAALDLLDAETRLAAERGEETEQRENERRKLVAEITALERQRGDVAVNAANRQVDAERELSRQLEQVRIRLLELQGDTVGARQAALNREFEELLKRLSVEGDAAGTELVHNLINVELARTRLEELQADYERTLARLARAERRVAIEVETGVISEREGRRRIIDLHRETATEVEKLIPLMRELAAATGDPEAIARIEEIELELEELGKTAKVAAREMATTFRDAGEGALADFISSTKSAGDAWDDFVDNIRRKAAQLISERIFDKMFDVFSKGGGEGGFFASLFGSFFHQGGIVGMGGVRMRVPALAFAEAPRLHSGGLGLGPNEVPAILERGEEVLTRRDPRHRLNGGAGDTININLNAPDAPRVLRQNRRQLEADVATLLQRSRNRNG